MVEQGFDCRCLRGGFWDQTYEPRAHIANAYVVDQLVLNISASKHSQAGLLNRTGAGGL
jgi:hypothetical protein